MIYARSIALRIYTDLIDTAGQPVVLNRDGLVVFSFSDASFAVVFSFGVVVFWNVPMYQQQQLIKNLAGVIKSPVRPQVTDIFEFSAPLSVPLVVTLSFVYAQDVVLQRMDQTVDKQLYQLNRILRPIEKTGIIRQQRKLILKKLGRVLRDRTHSFYEYGFRQVPLEASANAEMEKIYLALVQARKIAERTQVVNEKWNTVSDTMQFVLGLVQTKKGVRLEMILLLCAVTVDVLLTLWQIISR